MFKLKIYVGIAIIVFLGVLAMAYIYRSLGDVAGYLAKLDSVGVPFSIAALEMEKNSGEYASGVLRYINDPDPAVREEAGNDLDDFNQRFDVYMQLATNDRERSLGHLVGREHKRLTAAGNALMDQRDQLDKVFEQTTDMLEQIDVLADGKMMALAPGAGPERSATLAGIADIEAESAEVGFWLTLFRHRPKSQARIHLLDKIREQHTALSQYRNLPLSAGERKLIDAADALHMHIASNVNQLIIGETDVSQRVHELAQLADHLDDIFDDQIQPMLLEGLSQPQENADAAFGRVQATMRLVIPVYFLIALATGVFLVVTIIRPLKRLEAGTEAVGAGDLSHHIEARGKDEFGKLANQFNLMTARLNESTVSRDLLETSERKLRKSVLELRQEIAERRHAEREREKLQSQLQRTKTLAAMGHLVAGVAHEVRNPLFGISSTLDAMEANAEVGKVDPRYRDVLRREASRLNKLMSELLEFGRTPPTDNTVESLAKSVTEAIALCKPAAEAADVAVANQTSDDALVAMNHDRLQQVFVNLVENAVQHAPKGSQVVVTTHAATDPTGRRWIECSIMDSGPGIATEDLPRVFEPFFTRRRKGTGLGLAIVQRIVDEHHAEITAGNRPEGGAIMTVRLPVVEARS